MPGIVRDWRVEPIEAYPDILLSGGRTTLARGWPSRGEGWRDLLERACGRIRSAGQADGGGTSYATQNTGRCARTGRVSHRPTPVPRSRKPPT